MQSPFATSQSRFASDGSDTNQRMRLQSLPTLRTRPSFSRPDQLSFCMHSSALGQDAFLDSAAQSNSMTHLEYGASSSWTSADLPDTSGQSFETAAHLSSTDSFKVYNTTQHSCCKSATVVGSIESLKFSPYHSKATQVECQSMHTVCCCIAGVRAEIAAA